jgi:hypothetical protein
MESATTMNNTNNNINIINNPTEPTLRGIPQPAPQLANSSSEPSSTRFSFVNRGGIDQIIEGEPSTVEGDSDSSLIGGGQSYGDEIALVPGTVQQIRNGVCQNDHAPIVQVISVTNGFLNTYYVHISDGEHSIIASCPRELIGHSDENCSAMKNSIIRLQQFESEPSIMFEGRRNVII